MRIASWRRVGFWILVLFFSFVCMTAGLGFAQDDPGLGEGGHEVQVWAGGGHSVPGGTRRSGAFDFGFRYVLVIPGPHLPATFPWRLYCPDTAIAPDSNFL